MKLHLHSAVSAIKPAFQKLNNARKNQDERMANWLDKRLHPRPVVVEGPVAPSYIPVPVNTKPIDVAGQFAKEDPAHHKKFQLLLALHGKTKNPDDRQQVKAEMINTLQCARDGLVARSTTASQEEKALIGEAIHDIAGKLALLN